MLSEDVSLDNVTHGPCTILAICLFGPYPSSFSQLLNYPTPVIQLVTFFQCFDLI